MQRVRRLGLLLSFLVLGAIPSAWGKDLTSRLGVGIKNNTSFDLPQLAAVYYPTLDLGVTAGVGIDTQKDQSRFVADVGVRRIIFREDHMNFYFGGQVGLVNWEGPNTEDATKTDKQSGFELNALFGGEFFFTGLDNLAFTFEGGVGVASLKNVRFRTFADNPFRAGIIFFF